MTIKIVTDSTCDLPPELVDAYGITVVPCYINMGGKSYLDGVELSREAFYEQLPLHNPPPTTSAPGIAAFVEKYERLIAEGASGIVSIHISARLSNIVNVARLAAEVIAAAPVQVLDGGQLTIGTGLLVLEAAKAARDGRTVEAIVAMLRTYTKRVHTVAMLDTLEYLRRSGRLSRFQALMGTILRIKPLLTMNNDEIGMERVRTHQKAVDRLLDILTTLLPVESLVMVHTHVRAEAESLWQQISALVPELPYPLFVDVTTALGAHLGPGTIGFTCVSAEKSEIGS